MVVQGDRQLDETLKKLLFLSGRRAPDVFQNFVRVEELLLVEKPDAVGIGVEVEALFAHLQLHSLSRPISPETDNGWLLP